jgi:hypothetical protein
LRIIANSQGRSEEGPFGGGGVAAESVERCGVFVIGNGEDGPGTQQGDGKTERISANERDTHVWTCAPRRGDGRKLFATCGVNGTVGAGIRKSRVRDTLDLGLAQR